jgi:VWFA-related protein
MPNLRSSNLAKILSIIFSIVFISHGVARAQNETDAQSNNQKKTESSNKQQGTRPVTIPISIRGKNQSNDETRGSGELIEAGNITIKENGEVRQILNLRNTANSPLSFAVLVQDDLASQVNLELEGIANFIRRLPRGSRVMVAYMRGGSLDVRQRFTEDLERAAKSLRIIVGSSAVSPYNPYVGIIEGLQRFDNLPAGRRAMLVISDGLDTSRGIDSASPAQSLDLDRAVLKAQRSGVAVYSIYAATQSNGGSSSSMLVSFGQGSLNRLTEETGGQAFFQGTGTPVSFAPFLRRLNTILNRQFALTFLSPNSKKDARRIEVTSDSPGVKIDYPKNYVPR